MRLQINGHKGGSQRSRPRHLSHLPRRFKLLPTSPVSPPLHPPRDPSPRDTHPLHPIQSPPHFLEYLKNLPSLLLSLILPSRRLPRSRRLPSSYFSRTSFSPSLSSTECKFVFPYSPPPPLLTPFSTFHPDVITLSLLLASYLLLPIPFFGISLSHFPYLLFLSYSFSSLPGNRLPCPFIFFLLPPPLPSFPESFHFLPPSPFPLHYSFSFSSTSCLPSVSLSRVPLPPLRPFPSDLPLPSFSSYSPSLPSSLLPPLRHLLPLPLTSTIIFLFLLLVSSLSSSPPFSSPPCPRLPFSQNINILPPSSLSSSPRFLPRPHSFTLALSLLRSSFTLPMQPLSSSFLLLILFSPLSSTSSFLHVNPLPPSLLSFTSPCQPLSFLPSSLSSSPPFFHVHSFTLTLSLLRSFAPLPPPSPPHPLPSLSNEPPQGPSLLAPCHNTNEF
ncbi:hypothetical protein C7M84_021720 [Penaeus vannamei]|uniref:Uncharacterized protein n=1 Tax=Penaeus vannamei TaxID=6689 RepID=A0A3R7SGW0_PENVA|nr:hypothetical protein C7M84_021720 [Penaeus vannamei]